MRKSRFTDEQIVAIIRETDRDTVPEVAKRASKISHVALPRGLHQHSDFNDLHESGTPNRSIQSLGFLAGVSHRSQRLFRHLAAGCDE
jgi:hypothetical protein